MAGCLSGCPGVGAVRGVGAAARAPVAVVVPLFDEEFVLVAQPCWADQLVANPDAVPVPLPPLVNVDGVLVAPGPDNGWDFNPGALYQDALGLLGVN